MCDVLKSHYAIPRGPVVDLSKSHQNVDHGMKTVSS